MSVSMHGSCAEGCSSEDIIGQELKLLTHRELSWRRESVIGTNLL
jgi:hypothetical protein